MISYFAQNERRPQNSRVQISLIFFFLHDSDRWVLHILFRFETMKNVRQSDEPKVGNQKKKTFGSEEQW